MSKTRVPPSVHLSFFMITGSLSCHAGKPEKESLLQASCALSRCYCHQKRSLHTAFGSSSQQTVELASRAQYPHAATFLQHGRAVSGTRKTRIRKCRKEIKNKIKINWAHQPGARVPPRRARPCSSRARHTAGHSPAEPAGSRGPSPHPLSGKREKKTEEA